MDEYINKEAQEKMGNHYIKDDVRNVSTDDGVDEDNTFEVSVHTFDTFDKFIEFMESNFPNWKGYFNGPIDYHIVDKWNENGKYGAYKEYFNLLKKYSEKELHMIFEYWFMVSNDETAEDIIKYFAREKNYKDYFLELKEYEDNENFRELLEFVDWRMIRNNYFKIYYCTQNYMFYKREYSCFKDDNKDVNELIKHIKSLLEEGDFPMGMDYGCYIAVLPGEEKKVYIDSISNALKEIFKDDEKRLEVELSDLEWYSQK